MIWKTGDRAKRNDTGRLVEIIDVWPVGVTVFYRTQDVADGHTTILIESDLRPAPSSDARGVAEHF